MAAVVDPIAFGSPEAEEKLWRAAAVATSTRADWIRTDLSFGGASRRGEAGAPHTVGEGVAISEPQSAEDEVEICALLARGSDS